MTAIALSTPTYWITRRIAVNSDPNHGSYGNSLVKASSAVDVAKLNTFKGEIRIHVVSGMVDGIPERTHNPMLMTSGFFYFFIQPNELASMWDKMVRIVKTNPQFLQAVILSTGGETQRRYKMYVYTSQPNNLALQRKLLANLDIHPQIRVGYRPSTSLVSNKTFLFGNNDLRSRF
jgi:hypothetical protein